MALSHSPPPPPLPLLILAIAAKVLQTSCLTKNHLSDEGLPSPLMLRSLTKNPLAGHDSDMSMIKHRDGGGAYSTLFVAP
ncbi:hypothetical protein FRB99_004652, partial [Tulasnella sp. 403]